MSLSFLVVDDDPAFLRTLARFLSKEGHEVASAASAEEALTLVEEHRPDVVLLDLRLPGMDGLAAIDAIRSIDEAISIVVMTAHASISTAVDAIRRGATDFITKPVDLEALVVKLEQLERMINLEAELHYLQQRERQDARGFESFVGASAPMRAVYEKIRQVAATDNTTVLVTGRSGTGKELVARAVHTTSARKDRPLMQIDCTSIPLNLLESELFGHERGAFTGADRRKTGLFELADRGTLFLDEIGDMDISLQGKFLRVLQERSFRRVGGTRDLRFDVRVIAATHQDLEKRCDEGRFRRDLLYRLRVFQIELPPLRERGDDILMLAEAFLEEHAQRLHRNVRGFSPEARAALSGYSFPGNVRELRNLVEQAVILTKGSWITPVELHLRPEEPKAALSSTQRARDAHRNELTSTSTHRALDEDGGRLVNASSGGVERGLTTPTEASASIATISLEALGEQPLVKAERLLIIEALRRTGGNKKRAAELLGISRFALQRRLDKLTMELLRVERS